MEGRGRLLDEICEVCDYSRKHAIKLMNAKPGKPRQGRGRKPVYGKAELAVVKPVWLAANQPCGKLLKPLLPLWLGHWEAEQGPVGAGTREKLGKISASTLDRLLAPVKAVERRRRNTGTKPGSLIKLQIPIRTDNDDIDRPGYLEADTVAHCGGRMDGDFVWTLDMTDVFSQWTECRAVWNKGRHGVVEQVGGIEACLPFELLGFDSDNGGEFLNWHLFSYLRERGDRPKIAFTRSRAYRKNDNARVEQKNWTHARQLLGYDRLGNAECLAPLNEAYQAWCQMKNFFTPVMKLVEKTRVGARYRKKYDAPKTPAQRLLDWDGLAQESRQWLEGQMATLNPFELSRRVEKHLKEVFGLNHAELDEDACDNHEGNEGKNVKTENRPRGGAPPEGRGEESEKLEVSNFSDQKRNKKPSLAPVS